MSSKWVFSEVVLGRSAGKELIPIKVEECDIHNLLNDRQIIDMTRDNDKAWERSWPGLQAAKLTPLMSSTGTRDRHPIRDSRRSRNGTLLSSGAETMRSQKDSLP